MRPTLANGMSPDMPTIERSVVTELRVDELSALQGLEAVHVKERVGLDERVPGVRRRPSDSVEVEAWASGAAARTERG